MLQRLILQNSVGPLRPTSWPAQVFCGRHTVIYGHNGSGKSSLADLLGTIGAGEQQATVSWYSADGSSQRLAPGQKPSGVHVSAFTASWVRANLASFLEGTGDGAQAVVTLGSAAVNTASEIGAAEQHAADLGQEQKSLGDRFTIIDAEKKADCRHVQDEIASALHTVDRHFSRSRFDIPSIGRLLRDHTEAAHSDGDHDALVTETRQSRLPQITAPQRPSIPWADMDARLRALVASTPTSRLLDAIAGRPRAQAWVATGIELHEGRDQCCFCDGDISAERRTALAQHFDQSRTHVVEQVREMTSVMSQVRQQQRAWFDALPHPGALYAESLAGQGDVFARSAAHHERALKYLDAAEEILLVKGSAPDTTSTDGWPDIPAEEADDDLAAVVDHHNSIATAHEARLRARCEAALHSMVGRRAGSYQKRDRETTEIQARSAVVVRNLEVVKNRLDDLRSRRFTRRTTAELLTKDLDRVYGKRHLRIDVTSDGNRYVCLRDGAPALNMSEGERHTLALLYFLRTLDDASTGIDTAQRLVVVDDPSSSLDKESIFGTHARLAECLEQYGQTIVLTHDFELLRMLLTSRSSKLTKSRKAIRDGDIAEVNQPKVKFLEMTARPSASGRTSYLAELSRVVQDHPSEYHFLFDRVVSGLADPKNHDVLFLLPNAARRLLETFVSFRVPDRPNHRQRLEKLCDENDDAVFREVYDFCNRFSHGEDRHVAEPLSEAVVLREVSRCLDFIRTVDDEHFHAMMRSTGHENKPAIMLTEEGGSEHTIGAATAAPRGASIPQR